jgi:ABC-type uncharacterized transport system involved in gliding motility auxiliary subunit
VGAANIQVQKGYLGMVVRYGDRTEVIPFIEEAANLEYQLSRTILKLTRDDRPRIGLVDATQSKTLLSLTELLSLQYEIERVTEESDEASWESLAAVVVVDDGSEEQATLSAKLNDYFSRGGNLLLFINGVSLQDQLPVPIKSNSALLELPQVVGIKVERDLVYDLQHNEPITLGNDQVRYIAPYPFWIRASIMRDMAPWSGAVSNVLVGWPSTVTIGSADEYTLKPLMTTSPASGVQVDQFRIQPEDAQQLTQVGGSPILLGAIADNQQQRMVVIGNAHMVLDDFFENVVENRALVSNLIDWVSQDAVLANIPQRILSRTNFNFTSSQQVQLVHYVSLLVPPLVVTTLGVLWLSRRRKLTGRMWHEDEQVE